MLHHFNADGFEALYLKYMGGRPRTFTLPERREIKEIAKSKPAEHGLPFSTWSLAKLAAFLVAEGVVGGAQLTSHGAREQEGLTDGEKIAREINPYSYFAGCSNGGRQALMEAQRYPEDFDGIIAGAPGNNLTALAGRFFPWTADANTTPDGSQILGVDKVQLLHQKVLETCDTADGLQDGQVDDPRKCSFDSASLRCTAGPQADCLTDAQVNTIRKFYAVLADSTT
ncbi:tannase/feruloyl esterase family alpha/beta hydrolase [Nonomuraea wenchangensis]